MTTSIRTNPHDDSWGAAYRDTWASWREALDGRSALPNVAAGISTALVALPLNIALAIACGLPPAVGLITGAIAGILSAILGGSRLQVTGPEVALAPLTFLIVSQHGVAGMLVATFLAGLLQIALGLLRVGRFVRAVAAPVIGGFMAAVGLLVLDTQLPRLLGLSDVRALSSLRSASPLAGAHLWGLAVGAAVIAALILVPKIHRRIPAPLVGMGIGVAAVVVGVPMATLAPVDLGELAIGLPAFGAVDLVKLAPSVIALTMLASLDSLICAMGMEAKTGGPRTRADQELVAQGLANMASACVGGMPVAAAIVRSVAAHEAGATTRLAPLVQSVTLGLVLVLLAPLMPFVPVVALSAILLVVGLRLIDVKSLARMYRVSRAEAAIFVATAVAILARDFVTGVGVGVALSVLDFARRNARLSISAHPETMALPHASANAFRVVRLEGPLFFGSHTQVESLLAEAHGAPGLLVDLTGVPDADMTGAASLARVVDRIASHGPSVWLHGASEAIRPVLEAQGLAERIVTIPADLPKARRPRTKAWLDLAPAPARRGFLESTVTDQ
jgi:sulfate permease, SulP family